MSENKIDSHTGSTQPVELQSNAPASPARRRLTSAGLGVSAIFTLASRPVLAAQCTSPSAAASGNLSQHGTPLVCIGRTPGYWKNPQGRGNGKFWPSEYEQGTCTGGGCSSSPENWTGGTPFHTIFGGSNFKVGDKSLSLNQVMVMNDKDYLGVIDHDNLGAHIVAALLNAASGKTAGVLSENAVIGMWNDWVNHGGYPKGYYEPTAGVEWHSAQIVAYLKTTMTV